MQNDMKNISNSGISVTNLLAESESRNSELEKLKNIEEQIAAEAQILQFEYNQMQSSIPLLSDFDKLKQDFIEKTQKIQEDIDMFNRSEKIYDSFLEGIAEEIKSITTKLSGNKNYKYIYSMKKRLKHLTESNYTYKQG
ncbi:uncharacterized protein LOC115229680 [Octopus sinensis]|uniref:Uncharacterized protein LOC115229680 n=1 Tax=Octopus sinensis TaxID=2607531 RepID=A0A6P7U4L4_9MOLL|nr:uncharacterized protein LOC115229680 [Octopus sinensis]